MSCHGYEGVMPVFCTPLQVKYLYWGGNGVEFTMKLFLKIVHF